MGGGEAGEEAALDSDPRTEDGDEQLDGHPLMNHWAVLSLTGLPVFYKVWKHVTLTGRKQACTGNTSGGGWAESQGEPENHRWAGGGGRACERHSGGL